MVANFWKLQEDARKKTTLFLTLFILFTLAAGIFLEFAMRTFAQENYDPDFPILAVSFFGLTFGVAAFQYSMFQSFGGKYVAKSMGARLVSRQPLNQREQQLLNIVEEVALASSLPVPPVYLIQAKQINAFAAGLTKESAIIAVTEGSLTKLSREELQGVIAHEFGHIYNKDMRINLQLAAMIMGFFFIFYFALRMLQFSGFYGGRRDDDGERKGGNPLLIAALLLIAAGAFSWLVGSLLKAMVSRQREYLADASAVQFTRTSDGIVGALEKISKEKVQDMPKEGMAYSHMYLDNHLGLSSLFATHPPLEKRIQALLGKSSPPS